MDQKIYEICNRMETDFSLYKDRGISALDKRRLKKSIKVKLLRNKKKQSFRRKVIAITGSAAAFFLVALGTVCIANPAFAERIYSQTIGALIETVKGSKYEEEDRTLFKNVGSKALEVSEAIKRESEDGTVDQKQPYVTSVTDQGVTLSVSEVYFDGYILYYTLEIQTEDPELINADIILGPDSDFGETWDETNGILKITGDMEMSTQMTTAFRKAENGLFAAMDRQDLAPEAWADTGNGENQGNMEIELSFNKFTGRLLNEYDSKGNYKKSGVIEGEWNLYFPVISSSADNKTWALNENMNDITITQIKATPANLIIDYQYPDTKAEDFEDIRVNIFDQDGNPIPYDRIYFGPWDSPENQFKIIALNDKTTQIQIQFIKNDTNQTEIASFHIPLE